MFGERRTEIGDRVVIGTDHDFPFDKGDHPAVAARSYRVGSPAESFPRPIAFWAAGEARYVMMLS
ncbi:hypothetical protein GS528_16720 [Rhodococcus hoagii]|nr:hypothetical protein [Prescottella equi]